MLKNPLIVPNPKFKARNFLSLNKVLICYPYFVRLIYEQALVGEGGLSLNQSNTIVRGTKLAKN